MSYAKMMAMTSGNRSNTRNEYEHYHDPFANERYVDEKRDMEDREMRRQIGYGEGAMESRRRRGDDGRYMDDRGMRRMETSNVVDMQGQPERQKDYQIGGTFQMSSGSKAQKLTKQMAEEWVDSMQNEDKENPEGETWSMEQAKQMAKKIGYDAEGQKGVEFYAILNAMYSDFSKVAEKYDVDEPEFYACMAKAWLEDKDAVRNKAGAYYQYIVKK